MKLFCLSNKDKYWDLNLNEVNEVVPTSPKAALWLSQTKKNVKLPVDYLAKFEREDIYLKAISLSNQWVQSFKGDVVIEGIDLIACIRLQMLAFFQDVILSQIAIPRIIETYRPSSLVMSREPSGTSFSAAAFDGTAEIFEAMILWEAQKRKIKIELLASNEKEAKQEQPKQSKQPPPQEFTGKMNFEQAQKKQKIVAGLGSSYDLLILWPYLRTISDNINGSAMLLSEELEINQNTFRAGLSFDDNINYLFAGELPFAREQVPSPDFLYSKWENVVKKSSSELDFFNNPYLKFQVELCLNVLIPDTAKAVMRATEFFKQTNTACYIDDYCAGHRNRAWVEAAKKAKIITVSVPHGAVNLLEFYHYNADWALASGRLVRENLIKARSENSERVVICGELKEHSTMNSPSSSQIGLATKKKVLLLTGGFLQQAWTDFDLVKFEKTWTELLKIIVQHSEIEFVIKTHPSSRDLGDYYQTMVKRSSLLNLSLVQDKKLDDLLLDVSVAVLLGKPGTAGIFCIKKNIPLIFLDTMLCREVIGYQIWSKENGIPRIQEADIFQNALSELLSSEEKRKEVIDRNQRFLESYNSERDVAEFLKKTRLI
jgi:hypothetical protein